MNIDELKEGCRKYKKNEGRESFYDVAISIVDEHPLQASVIILATWNVSRFRYIVSNPQNLIDLKESLEKCKPLFEKLKGKELKTVNLDEIKDVIKEIYSKLSRVMGVEYTGGSKVMHLINKHLFVMWDSFIRDGYNIKTTTADDYFDFLKRMQNEVKDIEWDDDKKTLAKAIDEFNYAKYSLR